ncbi:orotidine-5'-phosphate decarboxylase [Proteiniborus sp. MB09-C3]|uniref:orotidine-5'-phosphate decarboxylase n=1 Tax=Proteiniborus sp. MB09-C3 TaxID=3050072 RepID=UPI002552E32A|nr:orotidine-5'-phosphate decarboxylase [Proteiniborus sp. MB09-C3]WIV11469.1 orotidine-5'-phosphate decarboxylase [Proteiniborus sp. MB09-C3]
MIIDKLYESVSEKGVVCVGLDTSIEYIPENIIKKYMKISDSIFEFNRRIIDATYDISACFKIQIAYYEALGIDGLIAYKKTIQYIKSKGCLVIADIKKGDISKTAEMYAKAHLEGDFESDFITLSPYMGMDSIKPYLNYVREKEKGLFILIRTSNEGAHDIQYIKDYNNNPVYKTVGEKIKNLGSEYLGRYGYSSIGGVVGCTHSDEAKNIRESLNNLFFLIPGYGAQGGTAEDVARYLKHGNGGIVNSSRGILLAYKKHNMENEFDIYAREEVLSMREAINNAVKAYEG